MSDLKYSVEVEFLSKGNLASNIGLDSASGKAMKLGKNFGDVGQKMAGAASGMSTAFGALNGVIDSVASSAIRLGVGVAAASGTALVTGLTAALHVAFEFNQEMENTRIALSTIANANGLVPSMGAGMRVAQSAITEMRRDARELPGEFKDLQGILTTIATPGAQAGLGIFTMEKMAAQAMAAGSVLGVNHATTGRELAMLLEGRARHSLPLFNKLGLGDPKAFNALGGHERYEKIKEALDKMSPSIELFKNTWEGIKTTAIDNIKQSLGAIAGPLFERVKELVKTFNNMGDSGKARALMDHLTNMGESFGNNLVNALDSAGWAIRMWYPHVHEFLGVMGRGLHRVFGSINPIFKDMARSIKDFMDDPAAFNKILKIAEVLAAVRAAGAAGQMAGSLGSAGLSAIPAAGAMGGAAALTAGGVVIAGLAVLALAVGSAAAVILDVTNMFHGPAMKGVRNIQVHLSVLATEFGKLLVSLGPVIGFIGLSFIGFLEMTVSTFSFLVSATNDVIDAFKTAAEFLGLKSAPPALLADDVPKYGINYQYGGMPKRFNTGPEGEVERAAVVNHTTHIHKVEIRVQSNQDPNRIAKKTLEVLRDAARYPITTTGNPNPSMAR